MLNIIATANGNYRYIRDKRRSGSLRSGRDVPVAHSIGARRHRSLAAILQSARVRQLVRQQSRPNVSTPHRQTPHKTLHL